MGEILVQKSRPIKMRDECDYSLVTVKRRYGGVVSRGIYRGGSIKVKSQFRLKKDDFLISKRQIVHDACGLVPEVLEGSIVSNEYSVLRARDGCDIRFIEYFTRTQKVSRSFLHCSIGIVIEKMLFNLNDWLKQDFHFPNLLSEQQKIADCLGSLDSLITAHSAKLAALQTHKKGLLQQLFSVEGETTPTLRFPEFQKSKEWEEVALGEIAEIKLGKMLDRQKHTTGHLLPYLNNMAVRWNEVDTSNLPQMYFSDRELDRFGLKAGDVVVCEGGEPGRSCVWDGRLPNLKFQKAIHRVRFNVQFDPRLLVLYLEAIAGTPQFEMLFTGGGIKHLTGETFSQLKIPLIPVPEQQKIASCLSSLDALITAQAEKIAALKTHKRGLMQQLFPNPEEVKG